jgi:anti-sigma B factor antagonist
MACKATVRQVGDVAIVDMSGRITLGDGSGTVRETVKGLIANGQKQVLINLKDVSYIDSAGLGELVGSYATMMNQGGQIKLLNAQSKVRDVLQVTKLYTVFENFTDEIAALRSFSARATAG